ncbi:RluA family pseudouridine synthase [Nonlabens marinus]|uniref:Ribosomal large subunit pseudouridine synthase A n=1 Tax=Nonlabens marinus S1-08 TaxID=1454201 RepID=W8W0N0_9FLAO|nr:RluA family pseudouridine synthase [Nonlabens marinus]BAO56611.1 ribosomal large subunit pseudouridine synthase A [Nonlabens marinus S1-08]
MKSLFHSFKTDVAHLEKPSQFNYPFYYEPHPLALVATRELQTYLESQTQWFQEGSLQEAGKMFGVLVVETETGKLGYLAGFSGKLAGETTQDFFVPPVYELERVDSFFRQETAKLDELTKVLQSLETDLSNIQLQADYKKELTKIELQLETEKERIQSRKRKRRIHIKEQKRTLSESKFQQFEAQQRQLSLNDSFFLREYEEYLLEKFRPLQQRFEKLESELETLKTKRREGSNWLQDWLFDEYNFLNAQGEIRNVKDIFKSRIPDTPPAATGDCAAPKLLQYAYENNLKPITMAEFWYGASPKSKVRQHGNFYPSCRSRCEPVLEFMLQGIDVEENPLLENPATHKELEIIYEDDYLLAINKPSEFLSVPGKSISDSVQSRMKARYPEATGPMIVHRLDMSTSGILLVAKNLEIYHDLQEQFVTRKVQKRYVAVLKGTVKEDHGYIDLPLRVDLDNRPYQLVDFEYGKSARTRYEVIHRVMDSTSVYFYPITGRTHQLRVHAAHVDGLNAPIVGDDLYGTKDQRLHLHAQQLTFTHPVAQKTVVLQTKADFLT